jgi:hypothetical protein
LCPKLNWGRSMLRVSLVKFEICSTLYLHTWFHQLSFACMVSSSVICLLAALHRRRLHLLGHPQPRQALKTSPKRPTSIPTSAWTQPYPRPQSQPLPKLNLILDLNPSFCRNFNPNLGLKLNPNLILNIGLDISLRESSSSNKASSIHELEECLCIYLKCRRHTSQFFVLCNVQHGPQWMKVKVGCNVQHGPHAAERK